jgi:hypothetical protein
LSIFLLIIPKQFSTRLYVLCGNKIDFALAVFEHAVAIEHSTDIVVGPLCHTSAIY